MMETFPDHAISRAYAMGTPRWRAIDSGAMIVRTGDGSPRVRDRWGRRIDAVDLEYQALTATDAELLHSFWLLTRAERFYWRDWRTEMAYECAWLLTSVTRPWPSATVPHRYDAAYSLLPLRDVDLADLTTLLGHWPMDDGGILLVGDDEALEVGEDEVLSLGGVTVEDTSGNDRHGVSAADVNDMMTTGWLDGALTFDGAGDYIDVAHDTALNLRTGGTIVVAIKPVSAGGGDMGRIADKSTADDAADGWFVAVATDGRLAFRVDGDTAPTYSTTGAVTLDAWNRVAVAFDRYGRRLYVGGVDVTGTGADQANLPPANTAALRIGNRAGATDRGFDGGIDDLYIYNRMLSAAEIERIDT